MAILRKIGVLKYDYAKAAVIDTIGVTSSTTAFVPVPIEIDSGHNSDDDIPYLDDTAGGGDASCKFHLNTADSKV